MYWDCNLAFSENLNFIKDLINAEFSLTDTEIKQLIQLLYKIEPHMIDNNSIIILRSKDRTQRLIKIMNKSSYQAYTSIILDYNDNSLNLNKYGYEPWLAIVGGLLVVSLSMYLCFRGNKTK